MKSAKQQQNIATALVQNVPFPTTKYRPNTTLEASQLRFIYISRNLRWCEEGFHLLNIRKLFETRCISMYTEFLFGFQMVLNCKFMNIYCCFFPIFSRVVYIKNSSSPRTSSFCADAGCSCHIYLAVRLLGGQPGAAALHRPPHDEGTGLPQWNVSEA